MCLVGAAVGAVPEMGGLCWPRALQRQVRNRKAVHRTASAEATIRASHVSHAYLDGGASASLCKQPR